MKIAKELIAYIKKAFLFYFFIFRFRGVVPEKNNATDKKYAVVLTPWIFTCVPWYSLALYLILRYKGIDVKLIYSNSGVDNLYLGDSFSSKFQEFFIKIAILIIGSNECLVPINKFEYQKFCISESDKIFLENMAVANAIHKFKSPIWSSEHEIFKLKWINIQARELIKLKGFLQKNQFDHFIIPGGVYGISGLFIYLINDLSKICTYDAGKSVCLLAINGITGYQGDIPAVFTKIYSEINDNPALKNLIAGLSNEELQKRMLSRDHYQFQVSESNGNHTMPQCDVLIPLNISWDLPALGKHRFFHDDFEWMKETVSFILEQTSASVVLRQHPYERNFESGTDIANYFLHTYSNNPRFKFVGAADHINTYDLLKKSKLVLPYVSTIGVEAGMIDVPVVMEAETYFTDSSFVIKSTSKADYFSNIKSVLDSPHKFISKDKFEAHLYYYISQYCTRERTEFTAMSENFLDWVKYPPSKLLNLAAVDKIVKAISMEIPIAYQNHAKVLAGEL